MIERFIHSIPGFIVTSMLVMSFSACTPNPITPTIQKQSPTTSNSYSPSLLPPTLTKSPAIATQKVIRVEPSLSATPSPAVNTLPNPGPKLAYLYLEEGTLRRFNFVTWSSEIIQVDSSGKINYVAVSTDAQMLAFQDNDGIKIVNSLDDQPMLIAKTSLSFGNPFLFSHDNKLLAYADGQGLFLYKLSNHEKITLQNHKIFHNENNPLDLYYFPIQWSSDDKWLIVAEFAPEGERYFLIDIATRSNHDFVNCYSDMAWSPNKLELAVTITYSGIQSCGNPDGLNLVRVSGTGISEKTIFNDGPTAEPSLRSTHDVGWDPSGDWYYFVLETRIDLPDQKSQLMMVSQKDESVQVLIETGGKILSPIYDRTYNRLLLVNDNNIIALDMDTHEKTQLGSISGDVKIASVSPDGIWAVVNIDQGIAILDLKHGQWIDPRSSNGTYSKGSIMRENLGTIQDSSFVTWEDL